MAFVAPPTFAVDETAASSPSPSSKFTQKGTTYSNIATGDVYDITEAVKENQKLHRLLKTMRVSQDTMMAKIETQAYEAQAQRESETN